MTYNRNPVFPNVFTSSWATLISANTAKDGTGTVATVFTATPSGSGGVGAKVDHIKVRGLGTNVPTVLRLFINNGSTNATAANNSLFLEVTIAATTLSEVSALADTVIQFDGISNPQLILPAGYKINATIGTAVAAGLQITAFGGELLYTA
ncbi:hypothetical protein [Paenibacillus sp. NEAU-GSW1]|uniref:hypothetical protein n=1 Tax=Paenibacillus sp. NEAU-GSW1 TaxID=2682486 RepID=UPI0012E2E33B|nr:hypothetical protein [Paenibacillus sp. NEAU-GSW1]MUT66010.1 hypothetical protein [Paenibacillus sp. NEAU-GSW1]